MATTPPSTHAPERHTTERHRVHGKTRGPFQFYTAVRFVDTTSSARTGVRGIRVVRQTVRPSPPPSPVSAAVARLRRRRAHKTADARTRPPTRGSGVLDVCRRRSAPRSDERSASTLRVASPFFFYGTKLARFLPAETARFPGRFPAVVYGYGDRRVGKNKNPVRP